jgi:hypothetical protein
MNKLILNAIIASLMLWSSVLFAHNPDLTRHPLTFYSGVIKNRYCISYSFNKKTLVDLHQNGNPLGLESIKKYYTVIKKEMSPPQKQGFVKQVHDLWQSQYLEANDICFQEMHHRDQFLYRILAWAQSNELTPFVDDRTQPNMFNTHDKLLEPLARELSSEGLPFSSIPAKTIRMLSCGDFIREVTSETATEQLEKSSPACKFASFCHHRKQNSELIVAGDIRTLHRQQIILHEQHIMSIPLDNHLSFNEQLQELSYPPLNFQFVLGWRLLCCCSEGSPNLCCGGFDLAAKNRPILKFLANVASVLDETAESAAVLGGYNAIEPHGVVEDVATFNETHHHFKSRIIRSELGEFLGILIKTRQEAFDISPADDEKIN